MADKTIVAFDLYGTLLSTESIAQQLEKHIGTKAQSVSALWRRYQLEYTWRLNSMGKTRQVSKASSNCLLTIWAPGRDIRGLLHRNEERPSPCLGRAWRAIKRQ